MTPACYFCQSAIPAIDPYIDIGGLVLCVGCYDSRRRRKTLPCEVCNKDVSILPSPLTLAQVCSDCGTASNLSKAYVDAKNRNPCDRCGGVANTHHATCYGQNLCHNCYEKARHPCTQLYRGDRGYPAFPVLPSVPALVSRVDESHTGLNCDSSVCLVCKTSLYTSFYLRKRLGPLPTLCEQCCGSTWWDYMNSHRNELGDVRILYSFQSDNSVLQEQEADTPIIIEGKPQ